MLIYHRVSTGTYWKCSISANHCDLTVALPDEFHQTTNCGVASQIGQEISLPNDYQKPVCDPVWRTLEWSMKVHRTVKPEYLFWTKPILEKLGTSPVHITIPDLLLLSTMTSHVFLTAIRLQLQQRHDTLQVSQANLRCCGIDGDFVKYGNQKKTWDPAIASATTATTYESWWIHGS